MNADLLDSLTEFAKVIVPLIGSYIAYRRATSALHKARAVEAACTFPTCGHVCGPVVEEGE